MRMSECRRKRKLGSGSENGLIDKSTQLLRAEERSRPLGAFWEQEGGTSLRPSL